MRLFRIAVCIIIFSSSSLILRIFEAPLGKVTNIALTLKINFVLTIRFTKKRRIFHRRLIYYKFDDLFILIKPHQENARRKSA